MAQAIMADSFVPVLPPVWGPDSYNDGAGMNNPEKTAAFLLHNMPETPRNINNSTSI